MRLFLRSGAVKPAARIAHATSVVPSTGTNQHQKKKPSTQTSIEPVTKLQLAGALYNWTMWLFIILMVSSQLLGIFWNTVETKQHLYFGKDPMTSGASPIEGFNDEPYTDRVLACLEEGQYYRAAQLSGLVNQKDTRVIDTSGSAVNGYRLVQRERFVFNGAVLDGYSSMCSLIASTLPAIEDFCGTLGYNVTKGNLRIVNGLESSTTLLIARSLPVLVMPFWDDAPYARFTMPDLDGSACVFRLLGKYSDIKLKLKLGVFRGVDRKIREQKTAEWLQRPGGVWKNGWYEDLTGEKWYSDVIATDQKSKFGVPMRQFETLSHKELDCINTDLCQDFPTVDYWGSKFSTTDQATSITSISISNGRRFGFFLFEQFHTRTVASTYDWETLVSNISINLLLVRWLEAMFALQYGYFTGHSHWHNAGIGCFANSRSFNLLPIVLLPKLKMTLSAFWSVGCEFEGEQKALSEAWFVMYPAILELLLLYFSLLNIVAKVLRRRISDTPFGPTVVFFCLLHYYRLEIATSGWFGIDGHVTSLILSNQVDKLGLIEFFVTDVSLRMNGNLKSLIIIKLAVLGVNLLPLLFTRSAAHHFEKESGKESQQQPLGIEKALAVRCDNLGGLGRSQVYEYVSEKRLASDRVAVNSYELVRLGYVVYGDRFMISILDWEVVCLLFMFQSFYHLWNHRVALFTLEEDAVAANNGDGQKTVSSTSQMCRLDDSRLAAIKWWHVTGRPVK